MRGVGMIQDDDAVGRTNLDEQPTDVGFTAVDVLTGNLKLTAELTRDFRLVYQSNSDPRPIVTVETYQPAGGAVPDKIKAELTFGGVAATPVWYGTSGVFVRAPRPTCRPAA